ncbi:MAG: AAA family ATPase [bacterium]
MDEAINRLGQNIQSVYRGSTRAIDSLLICLLARGHCLIEDVPGVGKTILAGALARSIDCTFGRIQLTPDLLPSDVLGVSVFRRDREVFEFQRGPIFANIVLADEINRAPPRTQAALLEAMQEHSVTAAGQTMRLPEPFFVLATQNPIEQEGTYPLPEAQLDRFLFDIRVGYPTEADEVAILRTTTGARGAPIDAVFTADDALALQRAVRALPCSELLLHYAARLVRASRPQEGNAPALVRQYVRWGAGPRAGQALILGAKACALLGGRAAVSPADIQRVAMPVLRHRLLPNFAAEADGVAAESLIDALLAHVPVPSSATAP